MREEIKQFHKIQLMEFGKTVKKRLQYRRTLYTNVKKNGYGS